jgi:hypothetical protein
MLGKKGKWLLGILAGMVVLAVILGFVGVACLDTMIEQAIVEAGPRLFAGKAEMDSVEADILNGAVEVRGLWLGNPKGSTAESFFKADRIATVAAPFALLKKEIHICEVIVEGPVFTFEDEAGEPNIETLMGSEAAGQGQDAAGRVDARQEDAEDSIKLKIDLVHMTNLTINLVRDGTPTTISMSKLTIRNLTGADGRPAPPAEIMQSILRKIRKPVALEARMIEEIADTGGVANDAEEAGNMTPDR